MNSPIEDPTARALAEYARALRAVRPSAQLDERLRRSFRSFENRRRRRYGLLAVAAGLGVIAIGGAIFVGHLQRRPFATHASSAVPADGALLRVRMSAATLALGPPVEGEPEFWIDLRVSHDGSTQIVRIVPVGASLADRDPHVPIDVMN